MTNCPKCGNDQIYRKARVTGFVKVTERFSEVGDDRINAELSVDNSGMYENVNYKLGDTCYCDNCGKRFKYSKIEAARVE